jgi:hypothetical protein
MKVLTYFLSSTCVYILAISSIVTHSAAALAKMTNSSEKFCLKWNDFQLNILESYRDLKNNSDFSDVTLVCDDNQQLQGHKIILCASSQFFNTLLKGNNHSHPMIYMMGLKAKNMSAIMDFIYSGEANIYQEDLDDFLALAGDLQLKGLAQTENETSNVAEEHVIIKQNESIINSLLIVKQERQLKVQASTNVENHAMVTYDKDKLFVAAGTTMEDVRIKLDSLMERSDGSENTWKCTVCGKATKGSDARKNMRAHIETHMEGLTYPCNQCGKVSRSSNALNLHVSRSHKK